MRCQSAHALPTPAWRRLVVVALVAAYLAVALTAWSSGNDLLVAFCVFALITAVLARSLVARKPWAWLSWTILSAGLLALTLNGHGRIALDLVPVAINLALAALFGVSLRPGRTPLIARAISAIEGPERLVLPRVAGYARMLTGAWMGLFLTQAAVFSIMLAWWLPRVAADTKLHAWGTTYLHVGGLLLPALFMAIEFGFRRWYLRHIPHLSLLDFMQRLVTNWPGLLRESATSDDKEH
ncbi:xanthomonadin biosynthesis protein [Dokdonella sp.]|uniref:xanthomonadin biosynthesis protein n=1 Tax=Dokdonella sp. TaxID=2291710 RepID=UPI003C55DA7B